jgi:hypothetical protein
MEQGEPCQHKPGCNDYHEHQSPKCCAPECWCLKLPAVCMKCEHSLGSHSHFGVPEMSCTVVGCPCNPYRRASTTEPVAQPVPLSQGWVHDGDCALNPATGERVPYQAEPVAPQPQVDSVVNAAIQAIEAIRASCEEDRKFRDYHLDKPFSII